MAIFDRQSRYRKGSRPARALDRHGNVVSAVDIPDAPTAGSVGQHLLEQGQRLDHLANYYLADGTGYWRIAELNDAMVPDALAEVIRIDIPESE